jgi:hypothetical protein
MLHRASDLVGFFEHGTNIGINIGLHETYRKTNDDNKAPEIVDGSVLSFSMRFFQSKN